MVFFNDYESWEAAVPGMIHGQLQVNCPRCETQQEVALANPSELVWYTCVRCREKFCIDWSL